jgi:hypothetical protein
MTGRQDDRQRILDEYMIDFENAFSAPQIPFSVIGRCSFSADLSLAAGKMHKKLLVKGSFPHDFT